MAFRWRDYRHGNKVKVMTLSAGEFIRRFLLHTLPSGWVRIRHYGLLGNRCRAHTLPAARTALSQPPPVPPAPVSAPELIRRLTGIDIAPLHARWTPRREGSRACADGCTSPPAFRIGGCAAVHRRRHRATWPWCRSAWSGLAPPGYLGVRGRGFQIPVGPAPRYSGFVQPILSGVLQAGCTPAWMFCGLRTPDRILFTVYTSAAGETIGDPASPFSREREYSSSHR